MGKDFVRPRADSNWILVHFDRDDFLVKSDLSPGLFSHLQVCGHAFFDEQHSGSWLKNRSVALGDLKHGVSLLRLFRGQLFDRQGVLFGACLNALNQNAVRRPDLQNARLCEQLPLSVCF